MMKIGTDFHKFLCFVVVVQMGNKEVYAVFTLNSRGSKRVFFLC